MMTVQEKERYGRHLLADGFGEAGQRRLLAGAVLVVGAGGLGSAVLATLAAAGVGRLGIVEFDTVSLSNLQRQLLYTTADLGRPKIEAAAERLAALNPAVRIDRHPVRLDDGNAAGLVEGFDLAVDCTDNFEARYALDRACAARGVPMVYGSAQGAGGQVSVFHAGGAGGYADLYPERPPEATPGRPVGVLAPLPGIVGSLQAMEAVKLLTGFGEPLVGRLLTIDARTMEFSLFNLL